MTSVPDPGVLLEPRGPLIDVSKATRYIAVAAPGTITNNEWLFIDPRRSFLPPVHRDYALLKVLFSLRNDSSGKRIPVHQFQHTNPVTPLDFRDLRDSDVIFIVGHGNNKGIYPMGPNAKRATTRLVDILTGDGNLKKLRLGKSITICLLSCRAGFGFHKGLALELSTRTQVPVTVIGALGFTFGSGQTQFTALNEVLIRGIPWDMEYFLSIPRGEAERVTSEREGKKLTVAGKQTEINQFKAKKKILEDQMNKVVGQLQSTEVNLALNEIDSRFYATWLGLMEAQFLVYSQARERSNLEFDMWHKLPNDGYVWTDARKVTQDEADRLLAGDQEPVDPDGYTSTR